ncbi:MAG: DUF4870 domain-containing protein [Acidobacteriota bacterium]|nr:DUF4870 domain-containing protein [Acidobacteriota bacterium]
MSYNIQYQPNMSLQTPEQKQWALFLHLSQLLNFLIPFGGVAAPILIWQLKKDEMPPLDAHGKMIVNWTISSVIYGFISFILVFAFFIGLIPILGLLVCGIVFPIIGGIKAGNGEFWEYPLTIKFLK